MRSGLLKPLFHRRTMSKEDLLKKLLAHRRIDPETGCWEWTKWISSTGYGITYFRGLAVKCHRASAYIFLGFDLSSPLMVCHRCDNPPCFNPDHLFVGTSGDNVADISAKAGGTWRLVNSITLPN